MTTDREQSEEISREPEEDRTARGDRSVGDIAPTETMNGPGGGTADFLAGADEPAETSGRSEGSRAEGPSDSAAPGDGRYSGAGDVGRPDAPLLGEEDLAGYRRRWDTVQTGFVDAPRRSVQDADRLVAELMKHLAGTFADERARLEGQWGRGEDVSTEDLRLALTRYRSFFQRLLTA